MRRLLYCPLHFLIHTRHAGGKTGRNPVCPADGRQSLPLVREKKPPHHLQRIYTDIRILRKDHGGSDACSFNSGGGNPRLNKVSLKV